MSSLSDLTMVVFIFSPLLLTIALVALISWLKIRKLGSSEEGPERLLAAAISRMPTERSEWGEAMMAELIATRGSSFRWWFALGCARVALFPPATTAWPRYAWNALKRSGSTFGMMSVLLPPLGLPFLWLVAIAADAFTTHDDFTFSAGLIPGLIGSMIFVALACILCGVPLGIAGLVRREQIRWLGKLGPCLSVCIFSYLMIVMHLANAGVQD